MGSLKRNLKRYFLYSEDFDGDGPELKNCKSTYAIIREMK